MPAPDPTNPLTPADAPIEHGESPAAASTPAAARPGARAALALLLVINLFNYIDRQVLSAVEAPIAKELLPRDPNEAAKMGLLAMLFLVSYMLAAPLFGWLADRMSRWTLIGLGVIAWSLASGGSGMAQGYMMLLITRMAVGIGEAAYGPAAPTIISDYFPVEKRGTVLAWFYMAIPVGSALGYTLGGLMHSWMDWRWAFYVVVPPGVALGLICFFMPEPPRSTKEQAPPAKLKDYRSLLKIPSYVLNTLSMVFLTFALGGIAFWMPRYVSEYRKAYELGAASTTFGVIIALGGLVGTLVGGILGDKLRPRMPGAYFTVSAVGMMIAFPMFLLVMFTPFPMAWVFVFLSVVCLFINVGPTNTVLANVTRPSIRAAGFALNILVIHAAGDAISPYIIGMILDATGGNFEIAFGVVSGAILVSGLLWFRAAPHLAADEAAAETPEGKA
jgi:MFS family permease